VSTELFARIAAFFIFAAAQGLILNHIHLFGVATPLLYVYFVLTFRRNYPRWAIMIWCFFLGLVIDMFSNTPGLSAGVMTLIGFIQPKILEVYIPHDCEDDFKPGITSMGGGKFARYTAIIVVLFHLVFFSLEAFNFFNAVYWLICFAGSALLTYILILVIENLRSS